LALRPLAILALAASAFAHPAYDIAADGEGHVYFLDWPRSRLMRVSAEGETRLVADLAEIAKRSVPHTLALDADGHVLVGATYAPRIWRVAPNGDVKEFDLAPWKETLAGGSILNLGAGPGGLHLLVSHEKERRFRLLDSERKVRLDVRHGEPGYRNLYGGSFCVGKEGTVYLAADQRIWKVAKGKKPVVLAGAAEAGLRDGKGGKARFRAPYGICCGPDGTLLVADSENGRLRTVDAGGEVKTLPPRLAGPHAVCIGPKGRIHVAEYDRSTIRIRRLDEGKVTTLATVKTR
jgi:sugar lactone lactonase YvrE